MFFRHLLLMLRMVRSPFLLASALACLLGWACAYLGGSPWQLGSALASLFLAMALHAAANVINDVADAQNGGDAINQEAIAPFSGGAGLLQKGEVTLAQTRRLAAALLLLVLVGGLALAAYSGWGLLLYGAAGVLLAWGYSAPPLQLMNRGVGELAVAAAWVLMVAGADFVQRGSFAWQPVVLGLSYALLMANVLLMNGVPDAKADAQVGKYTLVVRLGARRTLGLYLGIALCAHALALALGWYLGLAQAQLWGLCFLPLGSLPLSLLAAFGLWRAQAFGLRAVLRGAMAYSIAAALLHAVLWALSLFLFAMFK